MKLKKIASLALAGLMAVSMLAGCGDNSSSNNNATGEVTTGDSSAVTVFNDSQSAANDVKVTFSSSASLDAALAQAVKGNPAETDGDEIAKVIYNITGIENVTNLATTLNGKNDMKKNDKVTYLQVVAVEKGIGNGNVLNQDAAVKLVANAADEDIADLAEDSYQANQTKDTYLEYSYTGNVSVVTSETSMGQVTYYVAITVTKTATEKALSEKDA